MKRLFSISLLLVSLSVMTAFAQADLQSVARVTLNRTEPITVRELRLEMERRAWPNLANRFGRHPTTAELNREVQNSTVLQRRQVLEAMIDERLVMQAAERDRVTVTDAELNQHMAALRNELAQNIGRQPTEEEFALAVKNDTGQEIPAFRNSVRRQLTLQKYLLSQKQHLFNNMRQPTEADIINIYNLTTTQFIRPETIRFSMIMVPYGPDAASRVRARELADRLNREIGSDPSRFDEVVLRSRAPNSGFQAGDAGYIPRNLAAQQMMGEDFVNVAFSLRQGEVSRLIEGNAGFQILKITESLPQRALGLDDIIVPGTTVTVRQNIAETLFQQTLQETTARAASEMMAELKAGNPFQIMESNLSW